MNAAKEVKSEAIAARNSSYDFEDDFVAGAVEIEDLDAGFDEYEHVSLDAMGISFDMSDEKEYWNQ